MCNNITGFKFRTWEGFSKTHGSGGGPHQSSELEVCVFFLRWILYVIIVRGRVTPKRATGSPSHLFSEIMSNHHGTWRSVSLVSLSLAIVPWKNAGFWELTAETSANLDPLSNPDTLFIATLFDLVALINKLGADESWVFTAVTMVDWACRLSMCWWVFLFRNMAVLWEKTKVRLQANSESKGGRVGGFLSGGKHGYFILQGPPNKIRKWCKVHSCPSLTVLFGNNRPYCDLLWRPRGEILHHQAWCVRLHGAEKDAATNLPVN